MDESSRSSADQANTAAIQAKDIEHKKAKTKNN